MKNHLIRIIKFGLISGFGLIIDIGLYMILINSGMFVRSSSAIGSFFAIVFVYTFSSFILTSQHNRNKIKFFYWAAYQALSIVIFSNIVVYLFLLGMSPIESKLTTIPVSFMFNYLFINLILKNKNMV